MFFVKTECPPNKVDELTSKIAAHEVSISGNQAWVSKDGRYGFDILEARDEGECHRKYERYSDLVRIVECVPVFTQKEFIQNWMSQHVRF